MRKPKSPRAKAKGKNTKRKQGIDTISDIDEKFARLWLDNGMNASKAYRDCHPNSSARSSNVMGCQVLAKTSVQKWLQARLGAAFHARRDELTPERVVEEIRRLALTPRLPRGANGKLLPLKDWPEDLLALVEGWTLDDHGNLKSVKLAGKGRGVELAAKYHHLIVDQAEVTNLNLDVGSMTKEQIRKRLDDLTSGGDEGEE